MPSALIRKIDDSSDQVDRRTTNESATATHMRPDPLTGKPAGVIGAENLLADSESARTVTLKPREQSVSFDVIVTSRVSDVSVVSFEAVYDLDGEKTKCTEQVLRVGQP